ESDQVERGISLSQVLRFLLRQERIASFEDFLTFHGGSSNHLFEICLPEHKLNRSRLVGPREAADLAARETQNAVTAPDRMIEEGEGVVFGECGEPERQLSEFHSHWISIHAVETFLGNGPLREKHFVFVWRNWRCAIVMMPGDHEHLGELQSTEDYQ